MSVPVHSHELTLSLGQWGQVAWRKRIGGGECKGREEQKKIKRREREGVRKERKEEEKRVKSITVYFYMCRDPDAIYKYIGLPFHIISCIYISITVYKTYTDMLMECLLVCLV